jgi:pilus assembly protein Flp/PilA
MNPIVVRSPDVALFPRHLARHSHLRCRRRRMFMYQAVAKLQSLARRDEGQDLLEYALLVALIAVVAVVAVTAAGVKVSDIFTSVTNAI